MASKSIQKKEWGSVKKAPDGKKDEEANGTAPRLQRPGAGGGGGGGRDSPAPKLMELKKELIELADDTHDDQNSMKIKEVRYNGNLMEFALDDLPNYRRVVFAAGPPPNNPTGGWSMSLELGLEEYEHYLAQIDQHVVNTLAPRAEELMLHTLTKNSKTGKPVIPYTEERFRLEHFKSALTPPNPEKGYKALIRVGVPHQPFGPDGTARVMPKIKLAEWLGLNKMKVLKKEGTIHDLTKGASVCATVRLSRGIWFGQPGWGMKWMLKEAYIFVNKAAGTASSFDLSKVEIVTEADEEPKTEPKTEPETRVRPFMNDALPGYDDGTGGGGGGGGGALLTHDDAKTE